MEFAFASAVDRVLKIFLVLLVVASRRGSAQDHAPRWYPVVGQPTSAQDHAPRWYPVVGQPTSAQDHAPRWYPVVGQPTSAQDHAPRWYPMVGQPTSAQDHAPRWYPVVKPSAFYSVSSGLGAGGGANVADALRSGDFARLRLRLQQFRQSASAGWTNRRSGGARVLIGVRGYRNLHESFYGTGPYAAERGEVYVHRREIRVWMRSAFELGGGIWIQPRATLLLGDVRRYASVSGAPIGAGLPEHLDRLVAMGVQRTWIAGLEGGIQPRTNGEVQAHIAIYGHAGEYHQVVAGIFGSLKLRQVGDSAWMVRFAVDAALARTDFMPFYLLRRLDDRLVPGLSRFRFYGNDRALLGLIHTRRLFTILRSHQIQGVAALTLAQVYDDIGRDFRARVAIAPDRSSLRAGSVALEPSLGLGIQLVSLRDSRVLLEATLGVSAEGILASGFRIRQDLRGWDSAVR